MTHEILCRVCEERARSRGRVSAIFASWALLAGGATSLANPISFIDPGLQNSTGAACSFGCENGMGGIGVDSFSIGTEGSTGSGLASAGADWTGVLTFPAAAPASAETPGAATAVAGVTAGPGQRVVAVLTLSGDAFAVASADPSAPFADANWSADINFGISAADQYEIVVDDRTITTGDPNSYTIDVTINPDGTGSGLISTSCFASVSLPAGESFASDEQTVDWNGTRLIFLANVGACRAGSGFDDCVDNVTAAECATLGGVYLGDGTSCLDGADLPNEFLNTYPTGQLLVTQSVSTNFGDDTDPSPEPQAGSELNQLFYADEAAQVAFGVTGNLGLLPLGPGFNPAETQVLLFIDSERGGVNTLPPLPPAPSDVEFVEGLAGTTFDPGFEPDHAIIAQVDSFLPNTFSLRHVDLRSGFVRPIGTGRLDGFGQEFVGLPNPRNWRVAFDNSNTAGVGGSTFGGPDAGAATATTGIEMIIPQAQLGIAEGQPIRLMAMMTDAGRPGLISNQTLPPLPASVAGFPRGPVDFAAVPGQQFVEVAHSSPRRADYDASGVIDFFDYSFVQPFLMSRAVATDVLASIEDIDIARFFTNYSAFALQPLTDGPYAHIGADLNRDGADDIITTRFDGDAVEWVSQPYNGAGSGGTIGSADGAMGPAAADLDGDGDLDVIAGSFFSAAVYWWENDGASPPTFGARNTIGTGVVSPVASLPIDYDDDGDIDIFTTAAGGDRVFLFRSDGMDPPSFDRFQVATGVDEPRTVAAGDIDGDGDTDFVIGSGVDDQVSWHENTGGDPPVFVRHAITIDPDGSGPLQSETDRPLGVVVSDFDADGDADIAALSNGDGRLTIFINDGAPAPQFRRRIAADGFTNATRLGEGDLNRDGLLDLVVLSRGDSRVFVYYNTGASTPLFMPSGEFPLDGGVSGDGGFVGDVSGDGFPEIITQSDSVLTTIYLDWGVNDGFPPILP